MHILILGGTRFVGRHIANYAMSQGHEVTVFHRGKSLVYGLPGATNVVGDRSFDIERLLGGYDAIVDTSGYLPRDVKASCSYLSRVTTNALYVFMSTINVYRDDLPRGADESAPLWDRADPDASEMTPETYGPLKMLCERIVEDAFAERALVVRPGLVAGPYDSTDRFTYWVRRVARGGATLVPGAPRAPAQFIDVRDLAQWIVTCLVSRRTGTFNAAGARDVSLHAFLSACRDVLHSSSEFVWAPPSFLEAHGVSPWSDMPLWLPAGSESFATIDSTKALGAGLVHRPMSATILDTYVWDRPRDRAAAMRAGITSEREAFLLHRLLQEKPAAF